MGCHGTHLFAQLSSRSVYAVRNCRLDGTPLPREQLNYSVAHLRVFLSEFWSTTCPRAQLTTQNSPFSIASGCGFKIYVRFVRALVIRTPLGKILDPPLMSQIAGD